MNKLKIWLIPGLIVLLAIAGLVYFRGKLPEGYVEKPTAVEKEKPISKPKGFAKPVEPGSQAKAKDDSEAMTNALNSGDISDCDKITWSRKLKEQCEDNLNYAVILKSGDESQCESLHNEELKIQCYDKIYMTVAVDEKDPSVCEMIRDKSMKQMCLDQVQMIISRYAKSADDCSAITSEPLRQQCEDNFYMHSSAETLNIDNCSNISNANMANQCKKTVTKNIEVIEQSKKAAQNATAERTLQEILDLCDSLTGNKSTTCKDAVYPQLAFDKKDLSFCDRISDELKATECTKEQGDKLDAYYLRQSIASNTKTLCNEILNEELKQLCLSS